MNGVFNSKLLCIFVVSICSVLIMQLTYATPILATVNNKPNTIYQYTDKHGNVVITNNPENHHNAKKIDLPPLRIYERPIATNIKKHHETQDINSRNNYSTYSDTLINNKIINDANEKNIPQFSSQYNREFVLREELSREVQALQETMSMLEYNKKLPPIANDLKHKEQLKIIEDSISEHKKNIAILNNSLK